MNVIALPLSKAGPTAGSPPFQVQRRGFQAFAPDDELEFDYFGLACKRFKRLDKDIVFMVGDCPIYLHKYNTISPFEILAGVNQGTVPTKITSGIFESYFSKMEDVNVNIGIYPNLTSWNDITACTAFAGGAWNQSSFNTTVLAGAGSINKQMGSYAQLWGRAKTVIYSVGSSIFSTSETSVVSPRSLRAASLLEDEEDFAVRVEEFLGEFDGIEAIRELVDIFSDQKHIEQRRKLAAVFGALDDPETLLERRRFLVEMLSSEFPGDRLAAASALGRLGDPSVLPTMRTQGDHETSRIARSVILANIAFLERHGTVPQATHAG